MLKPTLIKRSFILTLVAGISVCFLNSADYAYSDPTHTNPTHVFPIMKENPFLTPPDAAWGVIKKPYPTAAWFSNLAIKGGGDKEAGLQPIFPMPYTVKSSLHGLGISLPIVSFTSDGKDENKTIFAQVYGYTPQLELGANSESAFKRSIAEVSDLTVSLKYEADAEHYMSAPIARGTPYITMFYHDLTPLLTPGAGIQSVNDQPPGTVVTGSRFAITLGYSDDHHQTWILYSEQPITITWKNTKEGWRLTTEKPYTGWLRLALLQDTRVNVKNDAALLDQYAQAIPVRGEVKYTYHDKDAIISFRWITQNNQAPLMMALPHQQQILQTPTTDKIKMRNAKGEMIGVVGSEWIMKENLPQVNFLELTDISALTQEQKTAIIHQLKEDAKGIDETFAPQQFGVYTSGKRFARAARLALIADLFDQKEIKSEIIHAMEKNLRTWIKGENKFQLQYDTTWGGIVPVLDDFGSPTYNDHHFHYGYYVYTMAVLAKLDPIWLQQTIQLSNDKSTTPRQWIDLLIRDYANNKHNDSYFPYARHTDPFDGHAYASGLGLAFADGRNQESVSESVNAYYAIALLGGVLHDEKETQWGQLLLGQELRAAHTYWQILAESNVYLPEFKKDNPHLTTIVFDGKVDSHTWFGAEKELAYGIEMLPFTAITSELLSPAWSHEAYGAITKIYDSLPDDNVGWKWFLLKARVLGASPAEYPALWKQAIESKTHDEGDSKTNTLYYIASFPVMKK